MESDAAYEYTAIEAPRTIRLLHLHPGSETDPVRLTLVVTALDDDDVPAFESVSYCWGSERDRRHVTCNDARLSITSSLFTGLVHFRRADRPRTLWADAVCINQADAAEKTSQVLLMPQIYSRASRTLVWLGVADDPVLGTVSPGVTESIRQAIGLMPSFDPENAADIAAKTQGMVRDARRLRKEGKPNILDHDWAPLAGLLARPWFRRKWVVQEVVLANQVVLYAGGSVEVPWTDLAQLAFNMEGLGIERLQSIEFGRTVLESTIMPLHCVTCIYMAQLYRHHSTLLDGVLITTEFGCTDPRDHVYSLLSLGGIGARMLPDYSASTCEVFWRFAIAMLADNNLKILSLAPDRFAPARERPERLEGLPSWAPDLRFMSADTMVSYTIRPQAFFTGGRGKPILSISDDQRVLTCQGRVIDTLKTFSTSFIEMLVADMPELRFSEDVPVDPLTERKNKRLVRWLEGCYRTAFGHEGGNEDMPVPDEERMMAFYRTMVCGIDIMRNRMPREIVASFPQYIQWATERAVSKQDNDGPQAPETNYSSSIDESILSFAVILKFCVTEHGRFSQVPLRSEPGDRVCVLLGGDVPFVIRPTGRGTYTVVGECYVDGVMDGEIFEGQDIETEPLEAIHFE
ncbi:heterokaryon incompatibility protein-domain-containing protein [Xylaria palmicola]|nr:heterokaryon incompatibility protein-domain-containing protein [Xylaria palmicola]